MIVNTSPRFCGRRPGRRALAFLLAAGLAAPLGCADGGGLNFAFLRPDKPAKAKAEDDGPEVFTLGGEGLVADTKPTTVPERARADMAAGREAFRREDYDKAERHFLSVADDEKNPPGTVQEAMYYRAECLRLTGHYPTAADVYAGLLNKFPGTAYREQCVQHMFDIANYWLDDTREEMREDRERKDGKRYVVWPRFVSFEKAKPFLDREGRAIEKLEQVRLHDINGPLADQALFMCGVVKMYHENFREADYYFSQIPQRHPDSKLAAKSLELAIFCKHMSTGGADYDGRKSAEARKMVQAALTSYPELANDKEKRAFLEKQRASIDMQQAEKELNMAEFYRRTGHPGSAYFYYELVQRRYPNTTFAQQARERWAELRAKVEKERGGPASPPAAPAQVQPQPQAQPAPAAPAPLPPGVQG
jgi:outer membrane protein assembly factor BamD (BamD/ComL family)